MYVESLEATIRSNNANNEQTLGQRASGNLETLYIQEKIKVFLKIYCICSVVFPPLVFSFIFIFYSYSKYISEWNFLHL